MIDSVLDAGVRYMQISFSMWGLKSVGTLAQEQDHESTFDL